MSGAKLGFSLADLQGGRKGLNEAPEPAQAKSGGAADESEVAALRSFEDLYEKHNGDLDLIFGELKANPTKAKKPHNRPKDAKEFARKYLAGFYNLLTDLDDEGGTKDKNVAEGKDAK